MYLLYSLRMSSDFERALSEERRKDALGHRFTELERERARGVRWAGCGPAPLPQPRSEQDLAAAAAVRCASLRDWRASDQGRLSLAVSRAQRAAEQAHLAAESARAALARSDESVGMRCREAADELETRGRDLIAAAQAARQALHHVPAERRTS
jgi:hypothetical protein